MTVYNAPKTDLAVGDTVGLANWFNTHGTDLAHLKEQPDRSVLLVTGTNAAVGDLVIYDPSGVDTVARTSSAGQAGPVGVCLDPITAGSATRGWVRFVGHCTLNVASAVAIGDLVRVSATAGQGETTLNRAEAFALATSGSGGGAGQVSALLLNRVGGLTGWARRATSALASASTLTPNGTDTVFSVTGTTTITTITAQAAGRYLELEFASAGCQVTSNGTTLNLDGNYISTAGGVLALRSDGTNWHEVARGAQRGAQNLVYATPNGSAGPAGLRALVAADVPSLSYVTSVALTVPAEFSVSGSPVTSSGTLAVSKANQSANLVYAGPASGGAAAPAFRALAVADLPAMPLCSLTISGLQSIGTSGVDQAVLWDTESADDFAMHSTVTNTDRITIPTGYGGKYRIYASLQYAANATGLRGVEIYINGVFTRARYVTGFTGAGNDAPTEYLTTLAVGDYIQIYAYQTSGGALNITTNSTVSVTFLSK